MSAQSDIVCLLRVLHVIEHEIDEQERCGADDDEVRDLANACDDLRALLRRWGELGDEMERGGVAMPMNRRNEVKIPLDRQSLRRIAAHLRYAATLHTAQACHWTILHGEDPSSLAPLKFARDANEQAEQAMQLCDAVERLAACRK